MTNGRGPRLRIVILVFLGSTLGCSPNDRAEPDEATRATTESATEELPRRSRHVLLISIDTLRADVLGCYGETRPTSPHIDRLAAEGVLFERAYATSPWTLPSHASLLSGRYPRAHGAVSMQHAVPRDLPLLQELLATGGLRPMAIINSSFLRLRFGVTRGFDRGAMLDEPRGVETAGVFETARVWLEEQAGEPFFMFLHDYKVHSDYAPPPRVRELFVGEEQSIVDGTTDQLRSIRRGELELSEKERAHLENLYAAEVRQVDDELGALLDALGTSGLLEETLVVITSDHGEEFFEHGRVLHGTTQYDEVLRIPLIVWGPGIPAGVRIPTLVSLVDVVPTILDVLGIAPAHEHVFDGRSLRPLWQIESRAGGGVIDAGFSDRTLFLDADHANSLLGVVWRGYKLVRDERTEETTLYDLKLDPGETRDVGQAVPEVRERLLRELTDYLEGKVYGVELAPPDAELSRRLDALGY